ncbi:9919_t:CDS:2 [Rhizophagus irregularis]|nr:9919_t:CDS:2 [Rhizophagus irregularis]
MVVKTTKIFLQVTIQLRKITFPNGDQDTYIPQMPQQPRVKITKGGNPVPNFEYVSYDRVQDLYEQNKGTLYFIPEGFEPVLVPNDAKAQLRKAASSNARTKIKKPPRPPNAFILYRRAKQPEIGRMWHEDPAEIRMKFQKMADAAKQEHTV